MPTGGHERHPAVGRSEKHLEWAAMGFNSKLVWEHNLVPFSYDPWEEAADDQAWWDAEKQSDCRHDDT